MLAPEMQPQLPPTGESLIQEAPPKEAVHIGSVALQHEIRAEDQGRVHDIEAAYEAAVIENEIFDVYDEAVKENEIRDAYDAAVEEDKTRSADAEEANLEEPKGTKPEAPTSAQQQEYIPSDPLLDGSLTEREQANAVLERAGHLADISPTSQITRDYTTGNIVVTDGDTVRIFDARSNKPDVTEYTFDEQSHTLSIESSGVGRITTHVGDYVPSEWSSNNDKQIMLPPSVAKMVGAKTAIPV
jgi:hypothetical protein